MKRRTSITWAACLGILLLAPYGVTTGRQRILPGIYEPEMIKVDGGSLFIVEGANVLELALEDLRIKRRFGGKGEGPGELKALDYWYNTVTILPERVFLDGYDKVVFFAKDGRCVREEKKPVGIDHVVPAGDGFVGAKLDQFAGGVQYQSVSLYDSSLRLRKELCRQVSPIQANGQKTEMIPDVLNFAVWEDRVYVEKSREGFVIDAYDFQGRPVARIKHPHERIAITDALKNESLERFKSDPFVRRMGFEKFKIYSEFVWPEAMPPIRDFAVSDGKIYVRTPKTIGGMERWIVMDLSGRTLGEVDLPRIDTAPLMASLYGVTYYTIHGGKLYFIKDNETTDEWELFVEEIK
jgi:hypothetical protein